MQRELLAQFGEQGAFLGFFRRQTLDEIHDRQFQGVRRTVLGDGQEEAQGRDLDQTQPGHVGQAGAGTDDDQAVALADLDHLDPPLLVQGSRDQGVDALDHGLGPVAIDPFQGLQGAKGQGDGDRAARLLEFWRPPG